MNTIYNEILWKSRTSTRLCNTAKLECKIILTQNMSNEMSEPYFPFALIIRPSEEGTNNPSEGSLGFLGRAALHCWWNMNLGPVARNREVVSQKNCSQPNSSHRSLYFSQLLDDWSNPCDVFVWTVFIFSTKVFIQHNPIHCQLTYQASGSRLWVVAVNLVKLSVKAE